MVNRSGQVLVLVLLVVVVALSIGLSVASRNITNLKTATQSERSQRAFSAAEGGVEDILSRLSNITTTNPAVTSPSGDNISVPVGDISATVNVKAYSIYESIIELGTVGQVNLKDAPNPTQLQIDWGNPADPSNPASIEVIEYYQTSGGYNQRRDAWQGVSSRANENGFSPYNAGCTPSAGFQRCALFNVDPSLAGTGKYFRVRPFWSRASVKVSATIGSIPLQNFDIESTARTSEGLTRKVLVKRNTLPSLPAAFDYALFSSGSITK